jgi:hypothetical protein
MLERITQKINSEISKLVDKDRNYEKGRVRELIGLKKGINETIDANIDNFGGARGLYADYKAKQGDMQAGLKDFSKIREEELSAAADARLKGNAPYYDMGVAQFFRNKNFNTPKENMNAFSYTFNADDIRRLKALGILSDANAAGLDSAITAGQKRIRDIHDITGNSQTAEKEVLGMASNNPLRAITSPVKTLKRVSDKVWNKAAGLGDDQMATYLTDPKALERANKLLGRSRRIEVTPYLKNEAFEQAEKLGITPRKYVSDWYRNNLQGKEFSNELLGSKGLYSEQGRKKIIDSSNWDMLPYSDDIIKNSVDIGELIASDRHAKSVKFPYYRTLTTPIEYNGRKMQGKVVLGYVGENKTPAVGRVKSTASRRSNNNIANNEDMSSPLYRYYTMYSRDYPGITKYLNNPGDFIYPASKLLGNIGRELIFSKEKAD